MPKYEMHVHTAEGDKVVKENAAEIVRLYHDAGYMLLINTEAVTHNLVIFINRNQYRTALVIYQRLQLILGILSSDLK